MVTPGIGSPMIFVIVPWMVFSWEKTIRGKIVSNKIAGTINISLAYEFIEKK